MVPRPPNQAGRIVAVCRSEGKGTIKEAVAAGQLRESWGLVGDAHADSATHRQVSLLSLESINRMRDLGYNVAPGAFAENLTTEGLALTSLPVGARLAVGGEAMLEITQHGKECHGGCAIFSQLGECIMPREGVFARVISGGLVRPGDPLSVIGLP